jgi:dGTP triphosphohydrolase
MDSKIVLAIVIIGVIILYSIYEIIKEKSKAKKDKIQKDEQNQIFKTIGNQLSENSLVNKELLKYLKISSQKYAEEITESQMRIVIESLFTNSQLEIQHYISKIIKENHIKGNEKEVTTKIKSFINNKYHKDTLLLKEFQFKETPLSDHMRPEWKEYVIENVLSCVIKEKGEKALQGMLQNLFDSFKCDMVESFSV